MNAPYLANNNKNATVPNQKSCPHYLNQLMNILYPNCKKGRTRWTPEEDETIRQLQLLYGKK